MRRLLLASLVMLCACVVHGQTVLTEQSHGLLPGNPNPMILTKFSDPGVSGAGVTWDFSGLPQVAPFQGDVVEAGLLVPTASLMRSNTCLVEEDLEAFMITGAGQLDVLGFRTSQGRVVRTYESPVVKMRYPFAYGAQFSGTSRGAQQYDNGYSLPVELVYEVEADAYGTLMLPGTTLKDALRVVTTHTTRYGEAYDRYPTTVVTYRWYVAAHRFPVLSLIYERRADGRMVPLKGAYNPIVVLPQTELAQDGGDTGDGQVRAVRTYPNPFGESLTVRYELGGLSNVTIALYDLRGGLVRTLLQARQESGAYEHSFESQLAGLAAGQYLLRVEASGNTLVQSVVKM